jgi:hypothetical protein
MKKYFFIIMLLTGLIFIGCGDDNSVQNPTVVATEVWSWETTSMYEGTASFTLTKMSDGKITITGNYHYQNSLTGDDVTCSDYSGTITITNDSLYNGTGAGNCTNSNPSIPAGYHNSKFTETVTGTIKNGIAITTTKVKFDTNNWPSLTYDGKGKKISGSGVTN